MALTIPHEDDISDTKRLISIASTQNVPILYPLIDGKLSQLASRAIPSDIGRQVSLFKDLVDLNRALERLPLKHQSLSTYQCKLGMSIIKALVEPPVAHPIFWQHTIQILEILPLIHERVWLSRQIEKQCEARSKDIVESVKRALESPSIHSTLVPQTTEENVRILCIAEQLRNHISHTPNKYDQDDFDELESLMQQYAKGVACRFADEQATKAGAKQATTSAQDSTTYSQAPSTSIKDEHLNSPLEYNSTTTIKREHSPSLSHSTSINATSTKATSTNPSPLASLFAERASRLETQQRERKLADRRERKAKAQAQAEALANDPTKAEQQKYAKEVKEQMRKDQLAREKILRSIEDDKIVRKEKAERVRMSRMEGGAEE
ncbi:MAG: hypothetical protein Q9170_001968 [Blastenia crenularia]